MSSQLCRLQENHITRIFINKQLVLSPIDDILCVRWELSLIADKACANS